MEVCESYSDKISEQSSREVLKKMCAKANGMGYRPLGSVEIEWFFKVPNDPKNPDPKNEKELFSGVHYTLSSMT
jgi:glutamine synthetase